MTITTRAMLGVIRLYRLILSPLLGPRCRYQPTCSDYAMEAIRRHGGRRGVWLSIRRIARCHPFGGWGYDPVPGTDADTQESEDRTQATR